MITVSEAKKILKQTVKPLQNTCINIANACGYVLSADVRTPNNVPFFDNSAMDGYAIKYEAATTRYKVVQHIKAGDELGAELNVGEAARIFTGAPLPTGADTVVQQELVTKMDEYIEFDTRSIKPGANVRKYGEQCKAGDIVIKAGTCIEPAHIGLIASTGVAQVPVYAAPTVGLIVTGNELLEPGSPLIPGHIYNSNKYALLAYLHKTGVYTTECTQINDEKKILKNRVEEYLAIYDLLILTGGISVGEHDYVYDVLIELGAETLFYKVKQKPGKPLYAGIIGDKIVFALPGNPASVIACWSQYVKPTLLAMMGHADTFKPNFVLPIANDIKKKAGLTHFLKAKKTENEVQVLHGQDSFNLMPFADANCLIEVPEAVEIMEKGMPVNVYKI
jgi:molybdopterin molybdotransferase